MEGDKAIATFRENYDKPVMGVEIWGSVQEAREIDFQRFDDRGLAPEGRQDPDKVVSFRCSKCAADHTEEAMARRGFVHERHVERYVEGYAGRDRDSEARR